MFNSKGYDIVFLGLDQWLLDIKGRQKYHGTIQDIVNYCTSSLGFKFNEIMSGLNELDQLSNQNHNGVHYGMYKTFILTFNKELPNERIAS